MFELIREHQLNIMLGLCAICAMMAIMLIFTRFLPPRRKKIIILMEIIATFLLGFDRAAYIYRGDSSNFAFTMVRLSNLGVFFLTPAVVLGFNLYLTDLILEDGETETVPKRLKLAQIASLIGMVMAVVAHFSGLYYYFDEQNNYQRGPGFLISYIIPVVIPIVQFTVIQQYRRKFSRLIYISLVMYIFIPIIAGIIQIFAYGISIVNMAMVLVSVSLYIFAYIDINEEVIRAHEIEVTNLESEQRSMRRLFKQTATAFVTAVEKRDAYSEGHAMNVAQFAGKIAAEAGKSEEECEEVYYAALLHDVGLTGIPDSVIENADNSNDDENKQLKQKPVISAEILSSITEYPYLSESARYACENYDGSGYPEGLKGDDIPETSRIIALADAYDDMISKKRSRDPLSYLLIREEFIRQSGKRFDPELSELAVKIIDREQTNESSVNSDPVEHDIICKEYKKTVSVGIPVVGEVVRIQFDCEDEKTQAGDFSAPSIVLFDSYDRRVHENARSIDAYRYSEYGEFWFNGHFISTDARNIRVNTEETKPEAGTDKYEITAGRFEDHVSIKMVSPYGIVDTIVALTDNTKSTYIGLTGENCHISNIEVTKTGDRVEAGDIERIADEVSYIDRLEADMPNVQIDRARAAYTQTIEINDKTKIDFHTMSLPGSSLVWHCPYIVLFHSDDKKVGGEGYREYALIKINGEITGGEEYAENRVFVRKTESFPGWEEWKRINKEGLECSVTITKKGDKVTLRTESLGIAIENITIIKEPMEVYAVLTGDLVALTDIRVS